MKLYGEFKGIFYTKMFRDSLEAMEELDENLFAKATLHFETCTGLQAELPLLDIVNLHIYNEEE